MVNNALLLQAVVQNTEFIVFACVLVWECISKKHLQKSEDSCVETVLSFHIMWFLRVKLELPGLSSMFLYLLRYLTVSKKRMHTGFSFDLVLNLHQKLLLSVRHYQQPEGSPYSTKCLLRVYVPPMQQRSVSEPVSTWTVNHSAIYTFIERQRSSPQATTTVPWDLEKNSFGFGSMRKMVVMSWYHIHSYYKNKELLD